MRLSQCLIVKNEENNIEKALTWAKEIAWEQIVVDTGSTDKTVEIAKNMGATVYEFPWINDFSAAKNFAIEKARGDWIAFLDADEYILPIDAKKLKAALREIDKYPEAEKPHLIRCELISLDDAGKPLHSLRQDRIFRNLKELRYKNRIHEALTLPKDSKEALSYYDMETDMTIYHTGYSVSSMEEKNKARRNVTLLETEVSEQPDNQELLVYLGEALISDKREEEADAVFLKVLEKGLDKLSSHYGNLVFYHLLGYRVLDGDTDTEFLLDLYRRATGFDSSFPDFDYLMGLWYVRRQDWNNTYACFELAITKSEQYDGLTPVHITAELKTVYQALTVSAYNMGKYPEAVRSGILCLRIDKYSLDVLQIVFQLFKKEPGEAQTASGTMNILKTLYDFSVMKDRIVIEKCATNVGFFRLAESMKAYMTEEEIRQIGF